MYWVVISLQFSFEAYFGFVISVLPFFQMFRFFFILWLALPQTQGASQIYVNHISPFLEHHESHIDSYVYTAHEKVVTVGSGYLARLVHCAREYVLHYVMKTEVQPYVPAENAEATAVEGSLFAENNSAAGSSYVDNFFSKFKQPPTFASLDQPTSSDPQTFHPDSSASADAPDSTLWGSVFKAGAAAIQSTLQLPKVNSDAGSYLAAPSYTSGAALGSFGDIMGRLDQQLFMRKTEGHSAGSRSKDVTPNNSTTDSTLTIPPSSSNATVIPSSSSSSSLVGFDVIKHDDSLPEITASSETQIPATVRRTSSMWKFWGSGGPDSETTSAFKEELKQD